jgi:hypothetical protein
MHSSTFKSPLLKALILSAAIAVTGGVTPAFAQKNQPKAGEDWITYKNERFGYQLYYPAAVFVPKAPDEDADEDGDAPDAAASNAAPSDGAANNYLPATGSTAQVTPGADDDDEDDGDEGDDDTEDDADDPEDDADDAGDGDDEEDEEEDEGDDDENGDAAGSGSADGDTLTLLSNDGKAKIVTFAAVNSDGVTPDEYRKTLLDEFGGYDKLDYQPSGKSWFVLSGYRGDTIYYQKVMFSCQNKVVNVFSVNFPTAEKPYYERLVEIMEDKFKTGRGTDTPAGC